MGVLLGRAALVGVVPLLVYGKVLGFAFVTQDDLSHVFNNPFTQKPFWEAARQLVVAPFQGLYIPLTYGLWGLVSAGSQAARGAVEPGPFHALSLILHLANTGLVLALLRKKFSPWMAFVGASLFALHPMQVETVAWISGLKDLLAALFVLTALWCWLDDRPWLAFLAYTLGLVSKPIAAVTPVLAWALSWSWKERSQGRILLGWLAWGGLFLAITTLAQPGPQLGWNEKLIVAVDALSFYLSHLAVPLGLCADYGRTPASVIARGWTAMPLVILAAGAAALIVFRSRRWLWVSAVLVVAPLLPVLGWVPFFQQSISTVADRYVYLSLVGVVIAFCHLPAVVQAVSLAAFTFVTAMQLSYWRNDITFYGRVAELRPTPANFYRLGMAQSSAGQKREAAQALIMARQLGGNEVRLSNNLALLLAEQGDLSGAERELRSGLKASPRSALLHGNLGSLLSQQGRYEEGREHLERAARLAPDTPLVREALVRSKKERGG